MLVCDRDIMELDISDMTTEICETLLVTVAVSDWNTRAWTFLEAFRARRTVHLLCKNNAVVSLQRVMQMVCQKCALEIGILLLAMSHCLPPLDDRELAREKGEARQRFQAGYLEVETSGHLLSHRPASRPGDDVVIWSLLIAEKMIFNNAEAFWNAMKGPILQLSEDTGRIYSRGASISTGYLVSKAPRLKVKGLSWAPATPTFPYSAQSDANGLNSYDEGHTASGNITPDGLVAPWWLWKFDIDGLQQLTNNQRARNLSRIKAQFLEGYLWGAILCPIEEEQGARWWAEGGRLRRNMVAVCATNDIDGSVVEKYTVNKSNPRRVTWDENWDENREAVGWEWRGVYNWDDIEPLPEWGLIKNFLIV